MTQREFKKFPEMLGEGPGILLGLSKGKAKVLSLQ
jgi:hypothetical protein